MKQIELQDMTTEQLVTRFLAIALDQYDAIEMDNHAKFNLLFAQMSDIIAELMLRPGDQRRALKALYEHPNPQVRYKAASATRDIAPQEARRVCEIISERNEYPQAADARGLIKAVDEGNTDMSWVLEGRRKSV